MTSRGRETNLAQRRASATFLAERTTLQTTTLMEPTLTGRYDDEHFSTPTFDPQGNYIPGDTGTNDIDAMRYRTFVGGFLGTPGGRIEFYNTATRSITVLAGPPLP